MGRQLGDAVHPVRLPPRQYLPFAIPGFGLVVALVFITLLGFLTANFVGRQTILLGESLLGRMPIVRNLYRGLKQIFETVLSRRAGAFQTVALIEYPRQGTVVARLRRRRTAQGRDRSTGSTRRSAVFLPTTPNPTSGFLLFVKRSDMIVLDMTVEDAAKMVISAGLVTPEFVAGALPTAMPSRGRREAVQPALSSLIASSRAEQIEQHAQRLAARRHAGCGSVSTTRRASSRAISMRSA